jgi:hypothetical protein
LAIGSQVVPVIDMEHCTYLVRILGDRHGLGSRVVPG